MKNSPRPLFLLHQTLQWAICILSGSALLASDKPKFIGLPDGEAWFITPENVFLLLQSPMAVSLTSLQSTIGIAHCVCMFVCNCSAMETHFMKLPTNSSCTDVASRGSLELGSECCNRGQMIFTRYVLQHSAAPFCELVWPTTRGWAVVTPRRFHFTITALTLDWGSSNRAEI